MNVAGQFSSFAPVVDGPQTETLPIQQIRDLLVRQGRLIALVSVLAIVLGIVYIGITPSRYTAQADMVIDAKRVIWAQNELAAENHPIEDASVESEIETTKSERVALLVAQKLHLDTDPEFVGTGSALKSRILALLRLSPRAESMASSQELLRRAVGTLKYNLRVTRLGRSYVEQIAYTSLDPVKAARIANAFADGYIEDQIQAKFDATRRSSAWLENRISELRKQASDAYKAVQDFKSQNDIIIGADGKLASEIELDQLGVALAKARADTTQANAKLERIERVLTQRSSDENFDIPDPVVTDALNSPVITRLRQQFLDDQAKEAEWSAKYGADHQAARNLRADMAALKNSIWAEISRIAESYKSDLQIARSQEASIDARMTQVFQKSASTRQSQVRLRELETAANTYRGIYQNFLTRFTQSVQQQSFPSTEARIITPATPPSSRSSPKVGLTLAFAAMCGLGLGIALALARDQMNRQIHTRAQLENLLGTTCLAVLPAFKEKGLAADKHKRGAAEKRGSIAIRQITSAPPFSATAEALRYIKVAIDLNSSGSKVIGMVSSLPGEGKTTVAATFAASVAKNKARTLLIDADLRNPSMTQTLGYAGHPGILDMVSDNARFEEVLITDAEHKFDFLPASTRIKPANSSDILNSSQMKQLLKAAKSDYDYVIVDLPPILPIVDVRAVAHLFDAFVLVVEWGSTSKDEVLRAVATSPIVSERLLGAVLNKADEGALRRFEGYSEKNYSYYSNDKPSQAI
ncbi:MAG: polysaccharide biosynthesis tyrosine autokinase [Rhizobiales bacterium]|nr:polysaccharide biosynthesis tyrosine autokinase [Hyphomicrobiales bacterium]